MWVRRHGLTLVEGGPIVDALDLGDFAFAGLEAGTVVGGDVPGAAEDVVLRGGGGGGEVGVLARRSRWPRA